MLTQTTIELLDMHLEQCPRCGKLPYIGYKRWDSTPFIIGCPRCETDILDGKTIEDVTHAWNKWAIAESKRQDQMEAEQ